MTRAPLMILSDRATEAHSKIQSEFKDIDPIVGVSQKMRNSGVPADIMTIDCLRSGKRIIIVLHDEQPEIVSYQFAIKDHDPTQQFEKLPLENVTAKQLFDWMKGYFSTSKN